ncbi:MAG TPA: hypothetical protein VMW17_24880 [Candidatus Binatia bacterium]|nr:hypothetical protein [Candidatus Binatia bacterium]
MASVTLLQTSRARAADTDPAASPAGPNPEMIRAIAEIRRKYGADAVMMEGTLLSHSIQAGSVLETAVTIADVQRRDARTYLVFAVETGLVYNDRELSADERLRRTWTRIVERSLRTFRALDLPADGLCLAITYSHKPYADEPDLRSHLSEGHGERESVVLYLLTSDVSELLGNRIGGQQLADRSVVLVNDRPQRIRVEPTEAPASADTAPTP